MSNTGTPRASRIASRLRQVAKGLANLSAKSRPMIVTLRPLLRHQLCSFPSAGRRRPPSLPTTRSSCCSKPPRPSGRFPGSDRLDRLPCLVPLFLDLMGYVKRRRNETGHPLQHRHQRLHLLRVARAGDDGRQDPVAPVGTCRDTHVAAGVRNCGEESRHVLPMISLIRKRWPNLVP